MISWGTHESQREVVPAIVLASSRYSPHSPPLPQSVSGGLSVRDSKAIAPGQIAAAVACSWN
jgi:hypothetical protein